MNKKVVGTIILAVAIGTGGFFAGLQYAKGNEGETLGRFQDFQNISPGERQQALEQARESGEFPVGIRGNPSGGGPFIAGGFVSGEIISVDEQSLTIKLPDGGSRIIFFSDSASIGKTTQGERSDLLIGTLISVNGSANSDGSMTAEDIQIRPISPTQ